MPSILGPVPTPTPGPWRRTENYLILGTDQWDTIDGGRTDVIMIAAIDWEHQRVGVIHIPRDLYVSIPGVGEDRINTVYLHGESRGYPGGGLALLRRVLTETLGIETTHYVRVNMQGVYRLVDALGGVTVTLECPLLEAAPDPEVEGGLVEWYLPAGDVYLDGRLALRFVRWRYYSSDLDRARRQFQLMWAIRNRALQIDVIPKIPGLMDALQEMFKTDLAIGDILRLARLGAQLRAEDVRGLVLDSDLIEPYTTENGAYVLRITDLDLLRQRVDHVFDAPPLRDSTSRGGHCPPLRHEVSPSQAIETP
ncbi:MAG: hypothetical protein Kow0047_09890 [Anaerolineae bacterium]